MEKGYYSHLIFNDFLTLCLRPPSSSDTSDKMKLISSSHVHFFFSPSPNKFSLLIFILFLLDEFRKSIFNFFIFSYIYLNLLTLSFSNDSFSFKLFISFFKAFDSNYVRKRMSCFIYNFVMFSFDSAYILL